MKKIDEKIKAQVLVLLQKNRSQKEIENRTGVCIGTIQDWAADWRKTGDLCYPGRKGFEFSSKAKLQSNGYYKSIRKRFNSMKWCDQLEKRVFGFEHSLDAIHYYLKDGSPRPCAYCGALPPEGKVWGLDRLDSSLGHIPGNLVPCCSSGEESRFLSCQTSKSKFGLKAWMKASMNRAYGSILPDEVIETRLESIYALAKELENTVTR